jgi:hypothetical protein
LILAARGVPTRGAAAPVAIGCGFIIATATGAIAVAVVASRVAVVAVVARVAVVVTAAAAVGVVAAV